MITVQTLRAIAPRANPAIVGDLATAMSEILLQHKIDTPLRLVHFLAQAAHESDGFKMVLDGPINRDAFTAYIEQALVPELRYGDVVIMDNLSSHKGRDIRDMIEAAGAIRHRQRQEHGNEDQQKEPWPCMLTSLASIQFESG